MTPPGTDVVDLQAPDNVRSALNPGYARRVLSSSEFHHYTGAGRGAGLLWLLWSAKEAAYKSLSPDGALTFSHAQFDVRPDEWSDLIRTAGQSRGVVVVGDNQVPVRWRWNRDYAQCVSGAAVDNAADAVRHADEVRINPAQSTRYCSMPHSSQAARALAHELLESLTDVPQEVWISRRSRHAPQLVLDAQVWPAAQVSLSHDGRFVAAVASVLTR